MPTGLELNNLRHSFGHREVIAGLSLSVAGGEIVCLLGPSGCGKTTTLRLAAGLETPQEGDIRINGTHVAGNSVFVPPEHRGIGLVLQDYALFPHMNVLDNVAFGLSGGTKGERRDRARGYLEQVGMTDFENAWPHTLSGGEQQRVALARALAPEPSVMLMDEPFSGLDVTTRAAVRRRSRKVLKERAVPTLIVTHDPEEALGLADRIAVMRDGRIVQDASPEAIFLQPEDSYVMELFGAPNVLSGTVRGGVVATPFGAIEALGFDDNAAVTVMFRGNALYLSSEQDGLPATVAAARLTGTAARVRLEFEGGLGTYLMEQSGEQTLSAGDRVHVAARLDAFRVFGK